MSKWGIERGMLVCGDQLAVWIDVERCPGATRWTIAPRWLDVLEKLKTTLPWQHVGTLSLDGVPC